MIHVTVYRQNEQITAFKLSGHAESGPYGYDLVCAGVSAVSFGAVNALFALCEIEPKIEQGDEGGYLHIALPDTAGAEKADKAQLLLEGMLISLETIEREYNQFIKITSK
jgi:uncharacterized protein YsxB (DUF464 family)